MDEKRINNKNIAAYALAGVALVLHFKFSTTIYVGIMIISIALVLFFFSVMGSIRARLAMIGFLMFSCVYSLIYFAEHFSYMNNLYGIVTLINGPITITAVIFLLITIDIEETASRFSKKTPVVLMAMLFILIFLWKLMQLIALPMLSYGELLVSLEADGLFPVNYPFLDSVLVILCAFISFTLLRRKAIGLILAPIVLIMVVLIDFYGVYNQTFISGIHKASSIYGVLSYYIFPLVATVLVVFFYFQPRRVSLEDSGTEIQDREPEEQRKG